MKCIYEKNRRKKQKSALKGGEGVFESVGRLERVF
jgi:hypothetical protein